MRPSITALSAALLLPLVGCNQYEVFLASGQVQESFNNQAEILFVIDNSSSMVDETQALGLNFNAFIRGLTDPSAGGNLNGLKDAADNYISYANRRGRFLDYQLAITTTDVEDSFGDLYALPGNDRIVARGDDDVATTFTQNLLCTTIEWPNDIPYDPEYECGDPVGDQVSEQYLDCLCEGFAWDDVDAGSGNEEPLEAVFMAMCRASENPPDACFEDNQFTDTHVGSNDGLLRSDTSVIPVIVTDEGDTSRRLNTGDGEAEIYAEALEAFDTRLGFAVIGPRTDSCNGAQATTWGVDRFNYMIDRYGGAYFDIANEDADGNCQVADFAVALEDLGSLLNSLLDVFPLAAVPNVDSIRVFVDGDEIEEAVETTNEDGSVDVTDGWTYLPAQNGIQFHGGAIPDYNADVGIYYLPLDGMPRTAPF